MKQTAACISCHRPRLIQLGILIYQMFGMYNTLTVTCAFLCASNVPDIRRLTAQLVPDVFMYGIAIIPPCIDADMTAYCAGSISNSMFPNADVVSDTDFSIGNLPFNQENILDKSLFYRKESLWH